jgi:DNA-binding response OmpR family regulator
MVTRSGFPTVPISGVPASVLLDGLNNQHPRVMVVDDESTIADTLTEIFMRSGYAAVAAYDGEGALELALLNPPELLISDVMLPGMSGIELALSIRRIYPDCKVLLFSGQAATSELLSSAARAGHRFEMLRKPVHPATFLARAKEALQAKRKQSEVSVK